MHGILKSLGFHGDPFEHLSAENEKDIDKYAVRPPYFDQTYSKASKLQSFILFGHRGSGKSATRVTVYKNMWDAHQKGEKVPLTVNLIDFDSILKDGINKVSLRKFVDEACFKAIEGIFTWLTAITDEERALYTGALTDNEMNLALSMVKSFYISRSEQARSISVENALKLLDQAWHNRAVLWIEKRWSSLSKVISSLANGFARTQFGTNGEQTEGLYELLYSKDNTDEQSSIIILSRLVEMVRLFGFSGISFLIDKIDETDKTASSSELSTQLIFPLLSNVRIFEIEGLAWILFVWDQIEPKLLHADRQVRLDKIPNAKVEWKRSELEKLLDARIQFFSNKKHHFNTISNLQEPNQAVVDLIMLSALSPRELIRLMDTIIREHDLRQEEDSAENLLTLESLNLGENKYSIDAAISRYGEQVVRQIAKIGKTVFINKDVQGAFRVGDQPARSKIQKWMDFGAVKQTGIRPPEDGGPGRGSHEYTIVDPRLHRLVSEGLIQSDDSQIESDTEDIAIEEQMKFSDSPAT